MEKLTDKITVTGQISESDLQYIKDAGFEVIVNNRPDNEEDGQPLSDALESVAQSLNLEYYHIPLASGSEPNSYHLESMRQAVSKGKKTLCFCRSGGRSAHLATLASKLDS